MLPTDDLKEAETSAVQQISAIIENSDTDMYTENSPKKLWIE